MKLLSGVNLTNKRYGLERFQFKHHASLTSVIHNFRKLIHELGYNSSLLDDSEIMAFEDLIAGYEKGDDADYLLEVLDFISYEVKK